MVSTNYGDPETRIKILESARELAETMGPGMRVADIADRAGVSRQAVYLHFGDRPRLVLGLLEHMREKYAVQVLVEAVKEAGSASETLLRLIEVLATLHDHVDRVGWLFDEAQHYDEVFAEDWRHRAKGIRRYIKGHISVIADDTGLAEGWDVEAATDLVFAVTSLGAWRELTRDLGWSQRRYVKRVHGWLEPLLAI